MIYSACVFFDVQDKAADLVLEGAGDFIAAQVCACCTSKCASDG